jgi:hypothetical protein
MYTLSSSALCSYLHSLLNCLSLRPKYSHPHFFLKQPQSVFFRYCQLSNYTPHRRIKQHIMLQFLVEWQLRFLEFNPLLNSSWTQFCYRDRRFLPYCILPYSFSCLLFIYVIILFCNLFTRHEHITLWILRFIFQFRTFFCYSLIIYKAVPFLMSTAPVNYP